MRYVGLLPHPGKFDHYGPGVAKDLIGKAMPFREYPGGPIVDPKVGKIVGARVDDDGVHLEIEIESDSPIGKTLTNLVILGSPHGADEQVPARPTFSVGYGEVTVEPDPLLRIGCIQPSSALDSHENRDALRDIVKAALRLHAERGDGSGDDLTRSLRDDEEAPDGGKG